MAIIALQKRSSSAYTKIQVRNEDLKLMAQPQYVLNSNLTYKSERLEKLIEQELPAASYWLSATIKAMM